MSFVYASVQPERRSLHDDIEEVLIDADNCRGVSVNWARRSAGNMPGTTCS